MRLTTRGCYGLRAMIELGVRYRGGLVLLREIAEGQQVSSDYLEQIMGPLRRAGLVNAVRGAKGGYKLARPPQEITIKEIVDVLEGGFAPAELETEKPGKVPPKWRDSAASELWRKVEQAANQVLEGTTLADLCARQLEKERKKAPIYSI